MSDKDIQSMRHKVRIFHSGKGQNDPAHFRLLHQVIESPATTPKPLQASGQRSSLTNKKARLG